MTFTPGQQAAAICAHCAGTCECAESVHAKTERDTFEFLGRAFPDPVGAPVIIHNCPVLKKSMPLPAVMLEAAEA